MKIKEESLIKIYIIIILYSNGFRLFVGRWGSIICDIFTIIFFVYCVCSSHGKLIIRIPRNIKTLTIFIFIIEFISVLEIFNPNIKNTLYAIIEYRKSYFPLVTLLVGYWLIEKSGLNLSKLISYVSISSIPIILYGIKQFFRWGSLDNRLIDMADSGYSTLQYAGHMRSVSIFSGPFHYGLFCVIIFNLFLYLFSVSKKKYYLICAFLSAFGCYCSVTRTNIVCFTASLVIWYFIYFFAEKKKNSLWIKLFGLFLIGFLILLIILNTFNVFTGNSLLYQMINSLLNIDNDTRFMYRVTSWLESIRNIAASPIWGWGIGSAGDTLVSHHISNIYVTSHSMYLKLMMETGIVVGIIYVITFIYNLYRAKQIKEYHNKALIYSLTASFLINGFVGSTVSAFPCLSIYWILIAALLLYSDTENHISYQR